MTALRRTNYDKLGVPSGRNTAKIYCNTRGRPSIAAESILVQQRNSFLNWRQSKLDSAKHRSSAQLHCGLIFRELSKNRRRIEIERYMGINEDASLRSWRVLALHL